MKLLDSNILIYASKPGYEFLQPLVAASDICVSGISYVEVLGYHRLTDAEREPLTKFFANTPVLPVSSGVLEKAVQLRRERKLNLGDSLNRGNSFGLSMHAGHPEYRRFQNHYKPFLVQSVPE